MKIILLGYMGSGKTTIGKQLSKKLFVPFFDLDHYIESREGASISDIFKEKGEIYFRKIEHLYLKEFLSEKDSYVLSLGGGTPCYAGNMDVILSNTNVTSCYLQASIPTLKERISKNKTKRPLVASLSEEKLTEFIAKHLFERRSYYEQAQHSVIVDKKDIDTVVAEIRILLH
ncbi:shikimate kinase [Pseudotenacibaculum sp. MALMAid0570]|uniref:shikimate kinase n=1 Tax=Pseudotenacibaculum sp. MALMAid0570 TaxID=3143938 RepID=UPI0032DF4CC0